MTADRWAEIDTLFQEASELAPSDRAALLDRRCAADADLRREVESLLANDGGSGSFLTELVGQIDPAAGVPNTWPPQTRIGEYCLERLLGAGGMGSVHLARRADGEFDHRVAIKFANSLTATDWAAERFRLERKILARLEHPNIARLLGGGTAPNGAPYLVMEYVDGEPLTAWCNRRGAAVRQRLQLFLGVCDAAAYAHRNLVVHRDIKPGNILVTASGVPKLLDFGISKPFDPGQSGRGETVTVRLMTPGYASPEQLLGLPVTTATDVYSLGVVLYETIAARAPFDTREAAPQAIQRALGETEPVAPSAASGSQSPPGDLDNIVLKAMQRDPLRRYSSVEQLAADVRAYLEGRPVAARAPTPWYRASRFLRRHRTAALAALFITLAAAGVAAKWVNDARRMAQFYRELRTLSRVALAELPGRAANKPARVVRREIGRLFDERMQLLLTTYASDALAVREIALGYEALGNQFGIDHERAAGMLDDALFYYGRAISALRPLYESGRADQHGSIILGRSYCGTARLRERMPDLAARAQAGSDFERCLEIQRAAIGPADPAPRALFVNEFVRAHVWTGDHLFASGRADRARSLYADVIRIARGQQSRDKRGLVWESAGLLRQARLEAHDPARAAELVRQARSRSERAAANPPAPGIDIRLHEVELAIARVRAGDAAPETALAAAGRLDRDYPEHPLAAELSAAVRAQLGR